jgi:malyl-CoA/(S)-citramalyl-CoA lyase
MPHRLHRSEHGVPAHRETLVEDALASAADAVFLDLEDGVDVHDKERARANAVHALREVDWRSRGVTISVRINSADTPWCWRDVVAVADSDNPPDMLIVPKPSSARDVEFVATLLSQIEEDRRAARRIGLAVLIETAAGLVHVDEIARVAPGRLESLIFGVGDFTYSLGARLSTIGSPSAAYAVLTDAGELHWQAPWHAAMTRILVAARANGLRPVDGPFADKNDSAGYRQTATMAATLGFEGKWALDRNQVTIANEVFAPTAEELDHAHRLVAAARAANGGARVSLDGRPVDAPTIALAEAVVSRAVQIDSRSARAL